MPSTLNGVYSAQRAIALNQAAIDIINNNIANINTPGYSKQRVEISQLSNSSGIDNAMDASQSGMGATVDAITRSRDAFLDNSYRRENADLNFYKTYSTNAVQLETIFNEIGDNGLTDSLNEFYNALSKLSANPSDYVTRNSLVQTSITLTTQFNTVYNQLQEKRTNVVGDFNDPSTIEQSELSTDLEDLNSKLTQVADLNQQINLMSAQGIVPNSLLDQRDQVLDEISEYIPITIKNEINNTVTISLGTAELVSGGERTGFFNVITGPNENNPSVVRIENDAGTIISSNAYSLLSSGKIGALLQLGGSDAGKLTIKGLTDSLNTLASNFAAAINYYQENGRYINNSGAPPYVLSDNASNPFVAPGPGADADPEQFFVDSDGLGTINAGNISVNASLINNPFQISAASLSSSADETGDGSNALLMSNVRNLTNLVDPNPPNATIMNLGGPSTQGYITNIIGQLGTRSSALQDSYDLKDSVASQLTKQRDSVTGVNLDEELTDLVRFQRAYEASAKIMTTINEMLRTIINMVG